MDVGFKLKLVVEGEDVRDDLALSGVIGCGSPEQASVDGHERVVEVALQGSVSVGRLGQRLTRGLQ
jgi:hypothetical protein